MVRAGFGKHIQVAKPGPDDLKLPIGYSVCYVVIISLVKYSILLFLWRIFSVPTFKKYLYIIAVIITAWAIAGVSQVIYLGIMRLVDHYVQLSMALMSCIPLQAYWDHSIEGRCIDIELKYLVNCIPNTATDVGLLILPIPHLLKLHVNKSQKIGLIAVFMLGGL